MNIEINIINHFGLSQADRVTVPKSTWNIVQHHALYLGQDEYGQHWMCENIIGQGVKLTRVMDFFKDVTHLTSLTKFYGTKFQLQEIINKALLNLGKPYNLIKYNCEHFVNDILHNAIESVQVKNTFNAFLSLLLVAAVVTVIVEG